MVSGLLQTLFGLLLLSLFLSLPLIFLYLLYELLWPRVSSVVERHVETKF